MKTTQMVFRKLKVGEKTKPTDYQYTKANDEYFMRCILDEPPLYVSNFTNIPMRKGLIDITIHFPVVEENYGNHIYRRL